jgi:RHS repeat-associated protein
VDYRTYDAFGNITSDSQEHDANTSGLSTTPLPVTYVYDPSRGDRLVSITYPDGSVITYNYDGKPLEGDALFSDVDVDVPILEGDGGLDNAISRVSSISDSSGLLQGYFYIGLDTPVIQWNGNNVLLSYESFDSSTGDGGDTLVGLDRFGRVVDQNWVQVSSLTAFPSIDRIQYGYDADGNVLYEKNLSLTNQSGLYTYNTLNQLTDFSRGTLNSTDTAISGTPSTTESWGLDNLGNQTGTLTDGTPSSNSFNGQNQEISVGDSSYSPTYDNNGNMTQDQNGNTYTYDAWNRLTEVHDSSDDLIAAYSYDALDRRITVSTGTPGPDTTTDLFYSKDDQVIEERSEDGSGNPTTTQAQYVWNPFYVNDLIQRNDGIWVEQDANYNVTSISDSSGNILERFVYDPYGEVTIFNAAGTSTISDSYNWVYLFQGGRVDPTTGLYIFQNRDYSPSLGRWVEQDVLRYINGLSMYQFLYSNPIKFVDPTGHSIIPPGLPGGGGDNGGGGQVPEPPPGEIPEPPPPVITPPTSINPINYWNNDWQETENADELLAWLEEASKARAFWGIPEFWPCLGAYLVGTGLGQWLNDHTPIDDWLGDFIYQNESNPPPDSIPPNLFIK